MMDLQIGTFGLIWIYALICVERSGHLLVHYWSFQVFGGVRILLLLILTQCYIGRCRGARMALGELQKSLCHLVNSLALLDFSM